MHCHYKPRCWRTAGATLLALAIVSGCSTADQPGKPVELQVAGPPIEASETRPADLYTIPVIPAGEPDEGRIAQHWSMVGREDKSAATGDREYLASPCEAEPNSPSGFADVVEAIAKRAASHRVVIINESHTVTRHRETTRQLLPKLRSMGFTVFAAETFTNGPDPKIPIDDHKDVTWVDRRDGYYSNEPVFGRLVRDAKALGYRLAAYEHIDLNREKDLTERIIQREIGQAQNLAKLLASMGRDERLVIHVGYAHAVEEPVTWSEGQEILLMAAQLKAITGIDPLTVTQTECRSDGGLPFLAKSPDWAEANAYDIYVSHPVEVFAKHRPVWRTAIGDISIPLPKSLRPKNQPLIIEAFVHGDPFDAVPIDRVYVEPGENPPLLLPPGRYMVRAIKLPKQ